MLFASSSKFCFPQLCFFFKLWVVRLGIVVCFWVSSHSFFYQCFRSSNSYIVDLLSCNNDHELASFTGFQAKYIICGSTCFEYNPHLSIWDKRITLNFRARFLPNVLHKTQHSVYSVAHGNRPHHKQDVSFLIILRKMLVSAVEGLHSTALWINKPFMWIISLQLCLLWVGLILI